MVESVFQAMTEVISDPGTFKQRNGNGRPTSADSDMGSNEGTSMLKSRRQLSWCQQTICMVDGLRDIHEHAIQHWQKERILMRQHYKLLLLCVFFQYVHSVATNVAYLLHVQREPLYDLGFAALPALSRQMQVVSEVMFFICVTCTILFALSPFVVRSRPHPHFYFTVMLARFGACLVLCQSLRIVCFLVTSLPGPNYHCRPGSPEYNPPQSLGDIFFRQDAFTGCGDLVFSSHTIFVTLCALMYYRYSPDHRGKNLIWVVVFFFGLLVIAARKHYSLDIFIAMYTVPLVWLAYEHFFPDVLPPEFLTHPHAVSSTHDKQSEVLSETNSSMLPVGLNSSAMPCEMV
jgi:phosphatidylethanolamine phospholipase C